MEKETKIAYMRSALFVGVFVFGIVGYGLLSSFVRAEHTRASASQSELARLRVGELAATSLERLVLDTEEDRTALSRYVVSEDTAAEYIEYLEALAREAILDVRISRVAVEGGALAVDLVLEGKFSDIFRALTWYEASPYRLRADRVRLEYLEDGTWRAAVAVALESFVSASGNI